MNNIGQVTNEHVLALRDAVGPDPVIVCRSDGTVSVELDATEAERAGCRLIARQHAATGIGQHRFPESMAAMLSGVVDGTTHHVAADGHELATNPFV